MTGLIVPALIDRQVDALEGCLSSAACSTTYYRPLRMLRRQPRKRHITHVSASACTASYQWRADQRSDERSSPRRLEAET